MSDAFERGTKEESRKQIEKAYTALHNELELHESEFNESAWRVVKSWLNRDIREKEFEEQKKQLQERMN